MTDAAWQRSQPCDHAAAQAAEPGDARSGETAVCEAWIRTAIAQVVLDGLSADPQQRAAVREALEELGCHAGEPDVELHLLAD